MTREERDKAERWAKVAFWTMVLMGIMAAFLGDGGGCVVSGIFAFLFSLVISHAEWVRMQEEKKQDQDPS